MIPALHILIEDFLKDQDVNPASRQTYKRGLLIWFKYCQINKIDIVKAKRNDVIAYKASLKQKELKILTINNYLTALRKWSRWLQLNGYNTQDVAREIRLFKKPAELHRMPLMSDEVVKLLAAPDKETIQGRRDYAIMMLMLTTAMRCIEVSRLMIGDIQSNNKGYSLSILRKGRNEKEYKMITPAAFDAIERYLLDRKKISNDNSLFASCSTNRKEQQLSAKAIGNIVKHYLKLIGLNDKLYTAHSLRHTVAVTLLEHEKQLYDVQLFLGHKSPTMTQIYLRYVEEQKRQNTSSNELLERVFSIGNETSKRII